ncbi:MAG TPA: nitrilase-related carbon-nitrogen hydrolase [Nitrospiria bacterium]|nr:nitrilase-related carbon-nitrogen hydrolase [Nitrospiria bacterium]
MKVGFLQTHPVFGQVEKNVDAVLRRLSRLGRGKADLMVLPELFNTGYQFVSKKEARELAEEIPRGATARRLAEAAGDLGLWMVAGIAERKGKDIYNSAVLIGPRGHRATYRKIHLFYEEKRWFTPGREPFRVQAIKLRSGKKLRVGMMVCFDWIFPESVRSLALAGAELIAHPSNLVLPYCPQAMVTRCIENRVFAVTANRVGSERRGGKKRLGFIGQSEIVSPNGEILRRASSGKPGLGIVEIDLREARRKTVTRFNHLFRDRRPGLYRG